MTETPTSTYWIDGEGILCSNLKNAPAATVAVREDVFRKFTEMTGGKKFRMIIDLSSAGPINRDIRAFYSDIYPQAVIALAFVAGSPLAAMMARLYAGIRPAAFPCRTFGSEQEAREWIRQF